MRKNSAEPCEGETNQENVIIQNATPTYVGNHIQACVIIPRYVGGAHIISGPQCTPLCCDRTQFKCWLAVLTDTSMDMSISSPLQRIGMFASLL